MIVDSHLHLFSAGYGRFVQGKSTLGDQSDVVAYERLREEYDIAAGMVVCYEGESIDPSNNAYVRGLAASRPWIHSVAYVSPSAAPGPKVIARLLSEGHSGIALYLADAASAKALQNWPAETWALLSNARAIVSLNAPPEATAHLLPLIERASGCAFVFAHLGLPGRHDTLPTAARAAQRIAPLLDLASLSNVAVKLSGFYAVDPEPPHLNAQPFVDLLLERFQCTNLHWGSDFSPALGYVSFDNTVSPGCLAALAPSQRAAVFGNSLAARLRDVRRDFPPV